MTNQPEKIFAEYQKAAEFKAAIGKKGLGEQSRINERFFVGDQWYGAKCGNERPLVRHNVIKRIGEFKMSQILSDRISVDFGVDEYKYGKADNESVENDRLAENLKDYYETAAERLKINTTFDTVLRNAYVSGTGILYTFWNGGLKTGSFADKERTMPVKGDIDCEALDIDNVFFADPYISDVQNQPYIIIKSTRELKDVTDEAKFFGADYKTIDCLENEGIDGKITVLTKLFKEYNGKNGYTIKSVKVTERSVIRKEFDTGLSVYPLSVFQWERRGGMIYGESEVTYLIPNQIAINRMITANVWSAMTTGMPMVVINGDTVADGFTNEPGQIIKIYGSNEDVAGAVKYVAPPDFSANFESSVQSLIDNTMMQSGANEVALGDSRPDNAAALATMRNAAIMPLQIIKNRFYAFVEENARIWVDFWTAFYKNRTVKIKKNGKSDYIIFKGEKLKDYVIATTVTVCDDCRFSEKEKLDALFTLFEKGIITKNQLIERLPKGIINDKNALLEEENTV